MKIRYGKEKLEYSINEGIDYFTEKNCCEYDGGEKGAAPYVIFPNGSVAVITYIDELECLCFEREIQTHVNKFIPRKFPLHNTIRVNKESKLFMDKLKRTYGSYAKVVDVLVSDYKKHNDL